MNKGLLIFNIIVTILLSIGFCLLVVGSVLDNELLVNISLFSTMFVYGIAILPRILGDDNE